MTARINTLNQGPQTIDPNEMYSEPQIEDWMQEFRKVIATKESDMVFATYGIQDWIINRFIKNSVENGISTVITGNDWNLPAKFSVVDWITKMGEIFTLHHYVFSSKTSGLFILQIGADVGLVEFTKTMNKITLQVHSTIPFANKFEEYVGGTLNKMESMVRWVYGTHGQTADVPLNYKKAYNEFYPFINEPLNDYFTRYVESDASVLILIGPPGTGKTTFIKNLLHFSGSDALVTFDPNIMASDSIFARFIEEETNFMVMEDADAFLKARTDGNNMMHKFLNVSDGLISASGKKMIFSTNLPSIRDVDEALMRPGRCFDVIEFRPLTLAEAQTLDSVVDVNIPETGDAFTLAELMTGRSNNESKSATSNRSVGFY